MPTILETIANDLAGITDREIQRVSAGVDDDIKEDDEVLLVIPLHIQRWFALSLDYLRQSKLATHAATFDAETQAQKDILIAQACRFSVVATIVSNIAWGEARELAGERAWSVHHLALRKPFTLVAAQNDETEKEEELSIQAIPLPGGAAQFVREMLKAAIKRSLEVESQPEDTKKGKPQ